MGCDDRTEAVSCCFNPAEDDPEEFDRQRINSLGKMYNQVLQAIRSWIERGTAFSDVQARQFVQDRLDWDALGLHLIGGCVAAEALAINPTELTEFWRRHTKCRIIPGLIINPCLDRTSQSYSQIDLARACVLSVGAIWEVLGEGAVAALDDVAWNTQTRLNARVARIVFLELSSRYRESVLEFPAQALEEYETDRSPLLRSSVLETIILTLCARSEVYLNHEGWIRDYENMRQLLDDLMDVEHDVLNGRITYPALLALDSKGYGDSARFLIRRVWSTCNRRKIPNEYRKRLRALLADSGSLEQTANKILKLCGSIQEAITKETLPGSVAGLLCLVEVKKAALYRLRANDWIGKRPKYDLFGVNYP